MSLLLLFNAGGGTAWTASYSETFTLSDSLTRSTAKAVADAFTLADAILKQPARSLAEAFVLAELFAKQPGRALADAFTLVDVIAGSKTMYRAFTDALTLADVLIRSTARGLAESFTLSDTLATVRARLLALTDAFTLADAAVRATARSFLEAPLALAESFLRGTSKRVSDAFSVAEAFATFSVKIRVFTDAFGLTESGLQRSVGKQLSDGLTLFDGAARSLARRFSETLAVLDGLAKYTQRGLSDFFGLADFVTRQFERSLTDSFELIESWAFTLVRGLGLYPRKFLAQVLARFWAAVGAPVRCVEAVASARLFQATTEEIMIYTDPKDPESEEDFQIDWSAAANGDTITASTWEVPSDLTVVASNFTGTLTTARLSGGVSGQQYAVKNLVTCASGQIRAQALLIPVAF